MMPVACISTSLVVYESDKAVILTVLIAVSFLLQKYIDIFKHVLLLSP